MFGRQTKCAIAAISRLAEVWDAESRLSAGQIARDRDIAQPTVAKILSTLSQAGLVRSIPGPGGGFVLARPPEQITLFDVVRIFERFVTQPAECPFGAGICGGVDPCPLHHRMEIWQNELNNLLHQTTFEDFRKAGAAAHN
jgi:Rrf2 family protein